MRNAKQHLASFGFTTDQVFEFIVANIDKPKVIYEGALNCGVTTTMLAEVIGERFPAVTKDIVRQYFNNNGLRGDWLDPKTFGDHEYLFIDEPMTWTQARAFAQKMKGDLVVIDSPSENEFIQQNALKAFESFIAKYTGPQFPRNDGGSAAYLWLGGSDAAKEGDWRWVDGRPIALRGGSQYQNWGSVEPDDYGTGQDYLAMALMTYPNPALGFNKIGVVGQWNDIDGNNLMPFVVELA